MSADSIAALMKAEGGTLPAYAWPGGYTMFYVTANGDQLCAKCATREVTAWLAEESDDPPVAAGAFGATNDYPEHDERCDNCGEVIEESEEAS